MLSSATVSETDGRAARRERTKLHIVEAYLLLLRKTQQIPTVAQISERAGYSVRTVFLYFSDVATLSVAACDYAIRQGLSVPTGDKPQADRQARIRFQVEVRAQNCENWLPLWRMLTHFQGSVPELARRVKTARDLVRERMLLMYAPELSALSDSDRRAVLMALESLTDYESWGRMREVYGLTIEEAREAWVAAIDRLLPPTPERG
jgi:AcrR family transcriptional regulator